MKRSRLLFLFVVLSLLITACGSPTSSTENPAASISQKLIARQAAVKAAAAAPTAAQQMVVIQLFQAMFNASPGADLLNLGAGLLAGGMSETALAELLTTTAQFQDTSLYPPSLSNQQFASRFIANLIGSTISSASTSSLVSQLTAILDAGTWTRGQSMWTLVSVLSTIPASDPTWGTAAAQLTNRLNVSYYYSVTKNISATDLGATQRVTASVTNDPATVTAAEAAIDASFSSPGWSSLGNGLTYPVNALTYYNGSLYAASYGVSTWNGSQWTDSSTGMKALFSAGDVYALAVSNNTLYAGGLFTVFTPDGNWYNNAARLANNSWTTCGSGTGSDGSGMSDQVNAMIEYNGQLYAGGKFGSAGGDPLYPQDASYIARFDGATWSPVGSGMNASVTDMVVYNNRLIVSGFFTQAGGVAANYIAQWNGAAWSPLGTGMNGKVTALAVYNGDLYAGGAFTTAGGVSVKNIARWNGQSWSTVGSGVTGNQIYTLAVYKNALYAGGTTLWTPDGSTTTGILKWDGSQWQTVGTGTDGPVIALLPVPDGSGLLVGGSFLTAGGVGAKNIAKYVAP